MLESFNLSTYSKGFALSYYGTKRNKLIPKTKYVRGLGISSYALEKFQSGEWKPKKSTLRKIRNFEIRAKFSIMRGAGMPAVEARRIRYKPISKVKELANSYYQQALILSQQTGKPIYQILWAFSHSEMQPSDIKDRYERDDPDLDFFYDF